MTEETLFPVPTTIEEAINTLLQFGGIEAMSEFDNADDFGSAIHFSTGMSIRNEWGMWDQTSPLHKSFNKIGLWHADDMSSYLIHAAWCKHQNVPFDPIALIKRFHDHWAKWAPELDPLTGKEK